MRSIWTVTAGQAADYSLSLTPKGGFSGAVTWSVTGLPTGAVATFTPNPSTGAAALQITTTGSAVAFIEIDAPAGPTLAIRRLCLLNTAPNSTGQTLVPAVAVLGVFLVGVMGLGWLLNRRKRAVAG